MAYEILSCECIPKSLQNLPNPPKRLFFCGQKEQFHTLINATCKIAIVGTRKPNPYTKAFVAILASAISRHNGVVISGGALGVDIIAHINAFPRTIMFSPAGLDIIYPRSNEKIIRQMMEQSLVMSEYECGYMPQPHSFLERNRLVIGLSDYVIIPQADMMSGSMQSARIACELEKPLFVLPHRIGESEGTNTLLAQNKAQCIYHIDTFIHSLFANVSEDSTDSINAQIQDDVLAFCAGNPSFEEAFNRFGEKIYEYELMGKIKRESGSIRLA